MYIVLFSDVYNRSLLLLYILSFFFFRLDVQSTYRPFLLTLLKPPDLIIVAQIYCKDG